MSSEENRDPLQRLFLEMIEGEDKKNVLKMIFDRKDEESIIEEMIDFKSGEEE